MKPGELSRLQAERRNVQRQYKALFDEAVTLFYRFDPIEFGPEVPADEYEPEVETILPRMASCHEAADVQDVVYEEFGRWFSPEVAGSREQYAGVSVALWTLCSASMGAGETPNPRMEPTSARTRARFGR